MAYGGAFEGFSVGAWQTRLSEQNFYAKLYSVMADLQEFSSIKTVSVALIHNCICLKLEDSFLVIFSTLNSSNSLKGENI